MSFTLTRYRILFFLALISPLTFALYTQNMWEDFFIMFRHSKNLAEGSGLTFNPGEAPVHGFTSPLATLLLSLLYFITGKSSYVATLWCFRILSACAFAGASIFLYKLAQKKKEAYLVAPLLYIFFITDIKALAFSSNGMETAFTLFFLSLSLYILSGDATQKILLGGLAFAGLMWTRPDGCIYIAVVGLTSLCFFLNRKEKIVALIKMGLLCALFYLPWFLWAYWYFGSPIPQPVYAKGATFNFARISSGEIFPLLLNRAETVFFPIYCLFGGWPWWLEHVVKPQALFCLLYWVFPTKDRVGRQASFCFFALCFYLTGIYPFPWYLPSPAVFAWITLASGAVTFYQWLKIKVGNFSFVLVFPALALLFFNILYIGFETASLIKIQQAEIEMGNRREVGLWLKENMKPKETAYMECVGYIGYFSDRKILDFPGLTTPRVAELRKKNNAGMLQLIPEINPDWIVLRGRPKDVTAYGDYVNSHYKLKKTFDATERLNSYSNIPGRGYADLDSVFKIFQREVN